MSDANYAQGLEKQNEELLSRLSQAETLIKKINRRKGVYPVFKLLKRKIKRGPWLLDCEYLTNCDDPKIIIPTVRYTLKYHNELKADEGELVGFQFWRQSINYRWALAGMSKYLNLDLKRVSNIEVDEKTGQVFYSNF